MLASREFVARRTDDAAGYMAIVTTILTHLLIWFVFMVAVSFSLVESPAWGLAWAVLVTAAVLVQFVAGGSHRASSRTVPLEGVGRISVVTLVGAIVIGFVFLYFAQTVYQILPLEPFMNTDEIDAFIEQPGGLVTYTVSFGVCMVLVTELCFRWWIPRTLQQICGGHLSVIVSSILFGLVAGMVVWAPVPFLYGLVLGYTAFIAGSVWASVTMMWGYLICWWVLGEFFPERDVTLLWIEAIGGGLAPPVIAALGSGILLVWMGMRAWRHAFA
jgi:membrane protease YdiL (CAAX protease family)